MALSSYPAGFKGGAIIKEVPLFDTMPGNVFWVSSTTGGAGNPGTFTRPLSTISGAIAKCTANNGDKIFVKPLHAEAISAAAGLVLSVAGVSIVGFGQGSNRPTLTWGSATTATMTVSAANVTIAGFIFKANLASTAVGINLLAGSTDFTVDRCDWMDNSSSLNFIDFINTTTTNNAHDGLTVTRNMVAGLSTGNAGFVVIGGNIDRFVFEDNVVTLGVQDNQQVIRFASAKIGTNMSIQRNSIFRNNIASTAESGDIFVGNTGTTNTGMVANNFVNHLDPLAESIINVTGAATFQNFSCGVVDKSGYLLPAADS